MTDNEIIKALECCYVDNCRECPLRDCEHCITHLDAFNLINRQKAEIERLTSDVKTLENVIKRSFFEAAGFDIDPLAEIKAEAVKEFVKRLDDSLCKKIGPSKKLYWKISADIDNLVKEMGGEG